MGPLQRSPRLPCLNFRMARHSGGTARNVTKSPDVAQDCSEEELRAVCKELFIPQRDHGIDAHGAARRDIASRECNSSEDDNHSSERDGIRRADAVD
jgi:hypothetical protein